MLQTIKLDRGCFACMLGGADGRTLFLIANEWSDTAALADDERLGQVLTAGRPTRAPAGREQDTPPPVMAP